jgi:hypothetical protein
LRFAQHLHHRGIAMIEEAARAGIERCDGSPLLRSELEVEHIEVLGDAFFANRFWNGDDTALSQQRTIT